MLPEPLKNYLQNCKDRSLLWETVSQELAKAGWSADLVSQAKAWYENPQSSQSSVIVSSKPKIKKGLIILGIGLVAVLFLASALSVFAYLIAVDKIPLNHPVLKHQISSQMFSLPFVPKPPKFVLQQVQMAHKKYLKASFDFSMKVKNAHSEALDLFMGSDSLDISVKGYGDFSNPKNPKAYLSVSAAPEFSFEMIKPDPDSFYVKISKLPPSLLSKQNKLYSLLTGDWIQVDMPTFQKGSLALFGTGLPDSVTYSQIVYSLKKTLSKLIQEDTMAGLTMTSEKIDGADAYMIQYMPHPELLDKIFYTAGSEWESVALYFPIIPVSGVFKTSDYLKDFVITLYVDKNDYYVRRGDMVFSLVPPFGLPSSVSPKKISVTATLKLSDLGVDFPVEAPSSFTSSDDLYRHLILEGEDFFGESEFEPPF